MEIIFLHIITSFQLHNMEFMLGSKHDLTIFERFFEYMVFCNMSF